MRQNKILIIGADGYIGTKLSKSLSVDYKIIRYSGIYVSGMYFFNLMNPDNIIDDKIFHKNDIAVFMAGISSPDVCENDFTNSYQINVTGTKRVIYKLLNKGVKVIFLSSDIVYGIESNKIFDETSQKTPFGAYGKMKSSVEDEFLNISSFLTLRLSYIFSFEDKFTKYLLSNYRNEIKEIFHPFLRSIVYVDDLIDVIKSIIKNWPENNIINVCGESLISRVDIANAIKDLVIPKLSFKVINPGDNFFSIRPPIIHTRSILLHNLLGRKVLSLKESIYREKEKLNNEN